MAELTAAAIRTIFKEEFSGLRAEMQQGLAVVTQEFANVRSEMKQGLADVQAEMTAEFANVRPEMATGFANVRQEFTNVRAEMLDGHDQILEAVQRLSDEDRDEMAGVTGRLRNHNERIARLERLSDLR